MDLKAKAGECTKCSEGGGGPIVIERTCKHVRHCNHIVWTEDQKSDECVKYCSSGMTD